MTEETINTKHRRKPLAAVALSLIMPGLGHVYCGKLLRGLLWAFLITLPACIIMGMLAVSTSPALMPIICILLLISVLIELIIIIDSVRIAIHTKADYQLKDYNHPLVYILFILLTTGGGFGTAFHFRDKFLEAFRIPEFRASMYPTVKPGNRFLANKIVYKSSDPQRGDVVVFISPDDRRWNHIKRVVAVASDTVEMKDNQLYINDQKLERTRVSRSSYQGKKKKIEGEIFLETNGQVQYQIFLSNISEERKSKISNFGPVEVPKHHCFVLGDNRNHSLDSRSFGPVPLATLKGRADYIYFSAKDWFRFEKIK
jgi:signal peptidase I